MSAVPKPKKLTVAEYFALEEKAERRSEFFDGEMFLMAGASREHNILTRNLTAELHLRLKGGRCQVFVADLRVKVDRTGLYTYPDLLIVCGEPEYAPENRNTLTNPTVVVEVLSDSTERYDRTTKFRHYKALPSVTEYLLVAQDEPLVERFVRQPDGVWGQTDFVGLDATLALAAVPVTIPLAEVYSGVEFPPTAAPLTSRSPAASPANGSAVPRPAATSRRPPRRRRHTDTDPRGAAMSAVPKPRKLTVAEYLAIEEKAEFKSEFYDGVMYPVYPPAGPRMMAGASREHNTVFSNLFAKLAIRLDGGPCQVFAADQRVKIDRTGLYCYPDLLIVCDLPEYAAEDRNALTNPKVVIEVLSPSTEKYDRTVKLRHYQQLPSVTEYVLVAQDEPAVERFTRQPDGRWTHTTFVGLDATMALEAVTVRVPLAEVYRGVEFPPPPRPGAGST